MKFRSILLSLAATAIAGQVSAQPVTFGTTQTGGANNVLATALAKVVSESKGLQIRIIPETGIETSGPKIDAGRMDVMSANATEFSEAFHGTGPFKDTPPMKNLRIIAALYEFPVAWLVRKDSDVKTMADLKGHKGPVGFSNQIAAGDHARAVLAGGGLTEADLDGVPVPNVIKAADEFVQGNVDATFFAVGAGKVKEMASQVGGIRYLPVPDTKEALEAMRAVAPGVTISTLQPRDSDPGIVGPTPVLTDVYYLLGNEQVSDEAVTDFLDVLASKRDDLVAAAPQWQQFDPKKMYRTVEDIPWHPASKKWFDEHGYTESQL